MRILILATVLCCAAIGSSNASEAEAAIKRPTNIPAQGLEPALHVFAKARDIQVVYMAEVVGELKTLGASGELTANEALKQLLSGTGLTFRYLDERTVTIVPLGAKTPAAGAASSSLENGAVSSQLRLAQAEDQETKKTEANRPSSPTAQYSSTASDDAAETSEKKVQEIIVTAQKRKENLQDVPIAISVLSGEKLDAFTGGGLSDALAYLPGIVLTASGDSYISNGASFISLRGVSASGPIIAGASPTAVYIDGVPYGFVKHATFPNIGPYDLDRVEVLRGPHGSLYGANALNGVVRVVTHDADLEDFELKTRLSTSTIKSGSETYGGDAAINLPLVPGKLAARAVMGYSTGGGWIDDVNGKNINDAENVNARLKLKGRPTEQLSIGLNGWISRDDNGAPSVADAADFYPGTGTSGGSKATVDFNVAGLEASYDFPGFTVTSMTSYIDYSNSTDIDVTWILPPGLDDLFHTRIDSEVFSEELNVVSTGEGAWRWSAGVFYRDAEDRIRQAQSIIFPRPVDFTTTSESFAVYGELTRLVLDGEFELTGGLRYFEDHGQDLENFDLDGIGPLIVRPEKTYTNVSPRAVLTWHATDEAMFYASYGEGFRSGGDQYATLTTYYPEFPEYKPDTLENYEIGAKGSLFDGRVVYEAAAYFIDWQDIQQGITVPHPLFPGSYYGAIANGDSASGTGYEITTSFRPVDGLDLSVSYSRSNLTIDSDVVTPGGGVLIPKGSQLSFSPKYTLGGSAGYTFALGASGLDAHVSAAANYTPGVTSIFLIEGQLAQITESQPTITSRANLAISSKAGWTATLFVENLPDERTGGLKIPNSPLAPSRQPRTMGLQFEYKY